MLGLLDKWFNLFSPSFYMMLRNINNKAYLKSFLEQQPVISYYTRVMEYDYDDHGSPTTVARYNFKYGSYEYQLSKIKKVTKLLSPIRFAPYLKYSLHM